MVIGVVVLWGALQAAQPLRRCSTLPNGKVVCACGNSLTIFNPLEQKPFSTPVVAADLARVENLAEHLYDTVKRGAWTHSQRLANDLVMAVCTAEQDFEGKTDTGDMDKRTAFAFTSVTRHARIASMEEVNELTLAVSEIASKFNPSVPPAIEMLEYYGRKLDIAVANRDLGSLRATSAELRRTWQDTRGSLTRTQRYDAARFDQIVYGLEHVKDGVESYAPLVRAEQQQAEAVEQTFDTSRRH